MVRAINHITEGKMGEPFRDEGFPTCIMQVTSEVGNMTVRNSANNAWNVNLNNGNLNNNNTYNRYFVVGAVPESFPNDVAWERAEQSFFKNKHDSVEAQRIHCHPAVVMRLARLVESGEYEPRPGFCFAILDPTPREIFAAFGRERLVHHYVAPFLTGVAESVHKANGDVSHGNRAGHSAQTGAEQIRDALAEVSATHLFPYIVKFDIWSFFTTTPRAVAYETIERYAREYYKGDDLEEKIAICKKLILHDPTKGCITLSSEKKMSLIPERKRMKNAKVGCGLPIGNYYSQIIANLVLASVDEALKKYGRCPRFVDDKVCIVPDVSVAKKALSVARSVAGSLGLKVHPDKVYIQPAHHGVNFCGRTIKGDRIYLSSRTIAKAMRKVEEGGRTVSDSRSVCDSANSYLGLMRHCTEWKNEKRLAESVARKYPEWLAYRIEKGHFVCIVRRGYTLRDEHTQKITNIISIYNETWKNNERLRRAC